MGYDVFGMNPINEDGKYFRANIWSWPSIMELVEKANVLPPDVTQGMYFNDGQEVTDAQALELADAIEELIGDVDDDMEYLSWTDNPGTRMGATLVGALQGAGAVIEPAVPVHSTSAAHVKQFITFCRASGGFEVC